MARILVVDGHDLVRWTLTNLLQSAGHEVDQAADGVQALECFAARPPDAVMMDAYLPRIDGLETCRRMRQESRVPILVLSTSAAPSIQEQALASGANAFLPKPVEFEGLLAWVRVQSPANGGMDRNGSPHNHH
jgi:CheY-like chemotaxis protein